MPLIDDNNDRISCRRFENYVLHDLFQELADGIVKFYDDHKVNIVLYDIVIDRDSETGIWSAYIYYEDLKLA